MKIKQTRIKERVIGKFRNKHEIISFSFPRVWKIEKIFTGMSKNSYSI